MKVSVIIPTSNEEKFIDKCLKGIQSQSIPPDEIIVVDNFSKDSTLKILSAYNVKYYQLKSNVAQARNYGFKKSRGDYLLFVDADTVLDKYFIENAIDLFKNNIGLVSFVHPLEKSIKNNFITLFYYNITSRVSLLIRRPMITGCAMAFKRNIFLKAGGFSETLRMAEDWDIYRKTQKYGNISFSKKLKSKTSMRRFKKNFLKWSYIWIISSIRYELGLEIKINYEECR